MNNNKQPESIIQRIPDVIKGWLGLVVAIAGIVIAIRTDTQLYVFIFLGIILVVWLSVAIYIVFARVPGVFSSKGVYRYENIRWAAFISIGFIIGFVFSFSIFPSNRLNISQVFVGTPVLTASPSAVLPTPTASVTAPPTFAEILIPTSTPTPIILFQENFLNSNNGWNMPVSSHPLSYSVTGKIIGGKLEYTLSCKSSSFDYICENWLEIPHVTAKNFDLMFDTRIVSNQSNLPISIAVKFRNVTGMNYTVYFSDKGNTSIVFSGNGSNDFITRDIFSKNINQGLSETNHFRIVARDSMFVIYANEKEIIQVEDGNNSSKGSIFLGLYMPQHGNGVKIEIDNIQIHEVQ